MATQTYSLGQSSSHKYVISSKNFRSPLAIGDAGRDREHFVKN
jgi:hypothetical protein